MILAAFVIGCADWSRTVAEIETAGRRVKVEHLVQTWTWRGAALDLVLVLGLLGTLKFWIGKDTERQGETAPRRPPSRWFVLGLVVALTIATLIRQPRMNLGFYNDEAHNFVRVIAGDFERRPESPDDFKWKPLSWLHTTWFNHSGNNSQPYSIAARLSYDTWSRSGGTADGEVSETAVRLPALFFGLVSLAMLALSLRQMTGDRAALWMLVAGMIHAWHIRYSTEARGYSLLMLAVALMFWFLHHAFRSGRWQHWLGFGYSAFLCVWSFSGSVYFLACVAPLVMGRQFAVWRAGGHGADQIIRPVIAGVFALLPALPLMLPLVPQLMHVMEHFPAVKGVMGAEWWRDIAGFLLFGCRWNDLDHGNPVNLAISRYLSQHPWLWLAVTATAGVTVTGLIKLLKSGGVSRLLVLSTLLSLLLSWWLMGRKGNYLNHWYVIYALPCVLMAMGAGLKTIHSPPRMNWLVLPVAVLALGLPAEIGRKIRHLGKQDERAAVLLARDGKFYPEYESSPDALRTVYGAFWCNSGTYDPRMVIITGLDVIERLVTKAREENRALYISHSHRPLAIQQSGELLRRVEDSGDFEKVATIYGQEEEQFTQHIWKLRASAH